jgi:hypothetical protein
MRAALALKNYAAPIWPLQKRPSVVPRLRARSRARAGGRSQTSAGPPVKIVEIVGSFTKWEKLPLVCSHVTGTWQITIPDIPGNRTHHYMLLADGQPVSDKNSDGLAAPDGPQEAQYQLTTVRGPRVLMLFAQTK